MLRTETTLHRLSQALIFCAALVQSGLPVLHAQDETGEVKPKGQPDNGPATGVTPSAARPGTTGTPGRKPAAKSAALKRAEKLYFSKKYETAAALLRKITDEEPENGRANSLLGDVYYIQGQHEKALSHLLRAAELNDHKAPDFFRLGQTYEKLQKPKEAVRAYQKAYESDEGMKEALFQIGFVYLSLERNKKKTIEFWQRFVDEAVTDPQREKVITVLKFLNDPNFILPDKNSPISLEEALMLGGGAGNGEVKTGEDKGAGHEKEKEKNDSKELLDDDKLN
ncbi:MAG: tetratricopeptide repeat protein [Spirochaetota bacterium]